MVKMRDGQPLVGIPGRLWVCGAASEPRDVFVPYVTGAECSPVSL